MKYVIVTNNSKVRDLEESLNDCQVVFLSDGVNQVLAHCGKLLLENRMTFITDFMGGRRARAFPYLTVFLKEDSTGENSESDWNRIVEYQMLDAGRKIVYEAYDGLMCEDFRTLDYGLTKTVISNLNLLK
ncbi:MAG: hypothetical protein RR361_08960 [Anaerovorax sp.]